MANNNSGQALFESILGVIILFLILLSIHIAGRTANLASFAESTARATVISNARGRYLDGTGFRESAPRDITDMASTATVGKGSDLPITLPTLSGRHTATTRISRRWSEGGFLWPDDSTSITRSLTLTGDPWDLSSSAGRKIRTTIRSLVVAGGFI